MAVVKDSSPLQAPPDAIHLWAPAFEGFGGGITAFSRELAVAVKALHGAPMLFGKLDLNRTWENLPLWGAGSYPEQFRTAGFAAGVVLAALRHQPTCILSTHLNFGPVAHFLKRFRGIPYTLVAHGIDVHSGLSPSRLKALQNADQIIAVSEWTRQRVLELGGMDESSVRVLPNTYDDSRFVVGGRPENLVRRYHLDDGEKVILTVARLDQGEGYKGYDRILQALPAIRESSGRVRYLIAGRGDDRPRLETMARDLGVSAAVTFTGFVPDEELPDHYRLADVFAMPSTGEGFGIVFLEAMGCGTPVLGGNRDGSVDALNGGKLGLLVDPTSVDAIAGGLISLLKRQGPAPWFNRVLLSKAVKAVYGRESFRRRVELLPGLKNAAGKIT